eukprot:3239072-Rhodomonas_salina.1
MSVHNIAWEKTCQHRTSRGKRHVRIGHRVAYALSVPDIAWYTFCQYQTLRGVHYVSTGHREAYA